MRTSVRTFNLAWTKPPEDNRQPENSDALVQGLPKTRAHMEPCEIDWAFPLDRQETSRGEEGLHFVRGIHWSSVDSITKDQ